MRPPASCTPMAFAPAMARAFSPGRKRLLRKESDCRACARLRVAGGWPQYEAVLGETVFPLVDISEEGFCVVRDGAAIVPDRAFAHIRRNGEIKQRGVARRVWTGPQTVGYRFEHEAERDHEPGGVSGRRIATIRRRLGL